jgi:hypothetical protein
MVLNATPHCGNGDLTVALSRRCGCRRRHARDR